MTEKNVTNVARSGTGVGTVTYRPARVKATLVEKRGVCPYEVGYSIIYGDPMNNTRPDNVCWGATHPLAPIVMACALGFKSWERDDPERYYVSCLSKKGTVWRVERIEERTGEPPLRAGRGGVEPG